MDQPADTTPPTTVQKLAAEGLGTAILVLVGCGSITYTQDATALGSALAFGLVLVGLGLAFARVSGGHFNPVISLGSALAGRLAWAEAGLMAAAQVVGGIVGGAVLLLLMKGNVGFDAFNTPIGASVWGADTTGYRWWAAILLELVLSAVLVMVALGVTDRRNGTTAIAPIVIGLTFAGLYLLSLPAVGGGINPARSIGADLFSGSEAIKGVWVFIVGPLLGVAVGGLGYPLLFGRDGEQVPGSGLNVGGGSTSTPAYPGYQQPWGGQGGQAGQPGQQAAPGGYAGGYGAPAQQGTPVGQGGQAGQSAPQAEQPIIQDGWQWDPQAQQWIPAQQQPGGWSPSGGESTQIRPPEGS